MGSNAERLVTAPEQPNVQSPAAEFPVCWDFVIFKRPTVVFDLEGVGTEQTTRALEQLSLPISSLEGCIVKLART